MRYPALLLSTACIFIFMPAGPGVEAMAQTLSLPRRDSSRRIFETDAAQPAGGQNVWILWARNPNPAGSNNQESYRAALETAGYRTRKIAKFRHAPRDAGTLLALPRAAGAALDGAQQNEILRHLARGGSVIADGPQAWLEKLGFHWLGGIASVSEVSDVLYPNLRLNWQGRDPVQRFTPPPGARTLMVETGTGQPLALAGRHESGRYLYLAAPLDPHTPDATSHFPYFARYLEEAFGRAPAPPRNIRIEAYYDPSFRPGADLNRLAAFWRESGIHAIYAAAWFNFPYGDLIKACHRSGVRVYAWFAFPAATQQMWDEHPEWRERSATGTDARIGWRYSLNLENQACFRTAMGWMGTLLLAHEWDGVNVTELNYDADFLDYLQPGRFVPMNTEVRSDFRARSGFDPAFLFQPDSPYHHKRNPEALRKFLRYREDIVSRWHRRVLEELERLRRGRNWEIIVTILDSLHGDYVRPALGVDARRIAGLMKQFDFTLQVEDPAHFWAQPPDRYRRFAKTYLNLVPDRRRLMFDVNVVPDRDISQTALPSAAAIGAELVRTVLAAASASGRAAIYSEHTVAVQDWELLRMTAAPRLQ